MSVRKAEQKDIERLLELNKKLYKNEFQYDETINVDYASFTEEIKYFENYISGDEFIYVAEEDGDVVGYLTGRIIPPDEFRKNVVIAISESMFVEEEYRSKGIGKSLRDEFYKWAEINNADFIRSRVSAKNKRKIDFDKREGFEEYEVILEKKLS